MGFFIKDAKLTADGIRMVNTLRKLSSTEIKVGFLESSGGYEDGTTVAQVAAWNEYGTEHMPSRPFMRQTVKENESKINNFANAEAAKAVVGSQNLGMSLERTGMFIKSAIQNEITDGSFTPNAASTIRKKGSSKPLIDTGRMRQSVQYEITRR